MDKENSLFNHCLYFAANSFSRVIAPMAKEEFKTTGLSPSHDFLMIVENDTLGISRKELCERLHLAPSTLTRFIDSLVYRGYLNRKIKGKVSKIYSTNKGKLMRKPIDMAWKSLIASAERGMKGKVSETNSLRKKRIAVPYCSYSYSHQCRGR